MHNKKKLLLILILVLVAMVGCSSEKKNSESQRNSKYEVRQTALYERLNGRWVAENGDYFNIYKEEYYIVEYSLGDNKGQEKRIAFQSGIYAIENNIAIIYNGGGDCSANFTVLLAEDGRSFEYNDIVFEKEN